MNSQSGLLWYKPPHQTFTLAAQQASRRFTEREDGRNPGAILLNPCHQQEFLPSSPSGRGAGGEGQPATLAGLPLQFDKDVRPNHLLVVAGEDPALGNRQKNSQRTAQRAGHSQPTPQMEVNQ